MKPAAYFSRITPISLHDPLAELLGATEDGIITYDFLDAVKLAGHACPTVAGAWLATVRGLRALYGEDLSYPVLLWQRLRKAGSRLRRG